MSAPGADRQVDILGLQSSLASKWRSLHQVNVQKRGSVVVEATHAYETMIKETMLKKTAGLVQDSSSVVKQAAATSARIVPQQQVDKIALHFYGDGKSSPADQGLQWYPDFPKVSVQLSTELEQAMSDTRVRLEIDVFKAKRKAIGTSEKDPVWFMGAPTRMIHHVLDQLVYQHLSTLSKKEMTDFLRTEGDYRTQLGHSLITTLTQVDSRILDSIMEDYKDKWYANERERQRKYNQPDSGFFFDSHHGMVWNYGYKFRRDAVERRILQQVWYLMDHPDPHLRRLNNFGPDVLIGLANHAIAQDLRPNNPPSIFLDDPAPLKELKELLEDGGVALDERLKLYKQQSRKEQDKVESTRSFLKPDRPVADQTEQTLQDDIAKQVASLDTLESETPVKNQVEDNPDISPAPIPNSNSLQNKPAKDATDPTTSVSQKSTSRKTRLQKWTHRHRVLLMLGATLIMSTVFVVILTGIVYGSGDVQGQEELLIN
jgi:hypothetical protein